MKSIKVLGSGCAKCNQTADFIKEIAQQEGAEIDLQKVTDPMQIMQYKALSTPAVVVDEKLVHSGSIPKKEKILTWL